MILIHPGQTGEQEGRTDMQDYIVLKARRFFPKAVAAAGILFATALAGCGSSKPPQQPAEGPRRYHLDGRVVSVETAKQQVVVDAGDIPGFMGAMTMGYPVKNPNLLTPLSPEDKITADVVVNGSDVYLENIVVVKKAAGAKPPAAGGAPSPQPAKQ
jgi:hypothetical protein